MTVEFSLPRLSDWQNHDVQRACSHSADCQDWQQTASIRLRLSGVRISCSERKFSSEFRRFVTEFWKFSSEFSIRTANTELHMANSKTCMAIHILHFTSYISHHHPVSLLSVLSPPKMTANPDVQGVLSVWQSQTHFFLHILHKTVYPYTFCVSLCTISSISKIALILHPPYLISPPSTGRGWGRVCGTSLGGLGGTPPTPQSLCTSAFQPPCERWGGLFL
jgi:hypothetical protein